MQCKRIHSFADQHCPLNPTFPHSSAAQSVSTFIPNLTLTHKPEPLSHCNQQILPLPPLPSVRGPNADRAPTLSGNTEHRRGARGRREGGLGRGRGETQGNVREMRAEEGKGSSGESSAESAVGLETGQEERREREGKSEEEREENERIEQSFMFEIPEPNRQDSSQHFFRPNAPQTPSFYPPRRNLVLPTMPMCSTLSVDAESARESHRTGSAREPQGTESARESHRTESARESQRTESASKSQRNEGAREMTESPRFPEPRDFLSSRSPSHHRNQSRPLNSPQNMQFSAQCLQESCKRFSKHCFADRCVST